MDQVLGLGLALVLGKSSERSLSLSLPFGKRELVINTPWKH